MWFGLATVAMIVGLLALRWNWRRRISSSLKYAVNLLGWVSIGVGLAMFCRDVQLQLGITNGLLLLSALAYAVVATGIEFRSTRAANQLRNGVALEPETRNLGVAWTTLKCTLAIVLSGIASIGIGVAFAVATPMPVTDRIVIGGILVPVLWGGGMAWVLSDTKFARAMLLLIAVSLLSYTIAFLPKYVA